MNTGGVHGSALGAGSAPPQEGAGFRPGQELRRSVTSHRYTPANWWTAAKEGPRSGRFRSTPGPSANRSASCSTGCWPTELPEGWDADAALGSGFKPVATRAASGAVLCRVGPKLPRLWGGSADLAGSNNTTIKGALSFRPPSQSTHDWTMSCCSRTLHFGIPASTRGFDPVRHRAARSDAPTAARSCSSPDYMRPAVRLAALADIDPIYVWTHDSIGLGEDGPTHQPIEHLAALRAIPNLAVVRPGDPNEIPTLEDRAGRGDQRPGGVDPDPAGYSGTGGTSAEGVARGGYVLGGTPDETPDVVIIGTGSELQLAVEARKILADKGVKASVVSMPCVEWFEDRSHSHRDSVLPPSVSARVAVEAAVWRRVITSWSATPARIVSIEHYGLGH